MATGFREESLNAAENLPSLKTRATLSSTLEPTGCGIATVDTLTDSLARRLALNNILGTWMILARLSSID